MSSSVPHTLRWSDYVCVQKYGKWINTFHQECVKVVVIIFSKVIQFFKVVLLRFLKGVLLKVLYTS